MGLRSREDWSGNELVVYVTKRTFQHFGGRNANNSVYGVENVAREGIWAVEDA